MSTVATRLRKSAKSLSEAVGAMSFADPVTHVYNPLDYAWTAHSKYLGFVKNKVRTLMLGMNPGPWGMAQTGVPFGEIAAARDWMGINVPVDRPEDEHPKRPIEGFECGRSEVSGRRLWGLFSKRYPDKNDFFAEHFIANYCPLVFMEESARNRTPDKLAATERNALHAACDRHLCEVIEILQPEHLVGVGAYAEACLKRVKESIDSAAKLSRILHPSPASPAANKDWAGTAEKQLIAAGVWTE